MRAIVTGCAFLALAACQPAIPDSAAGVGFDNAVMSPPPRTEPPQTALPPASAMSQESLAPSRSAPTAQPAPAAQAAPTVRTPAAQTRPMATTALAAPPQPPAAPASTAATQSPAADARDLTPPAAGQAQTSADGVVQASPSNPAPELIGNPGISDENNFDAVGARRSIEDDAARLASNRENYQVISPTDLPERTSTGPNIVAYALSLTHPVGTKMYSRIGLTTKTRHQKACAKYATSGDAQSAFLSKGGPKKDRFGLDPDGDGYACAWDPAPFRRAARK